MRILMVSEDVPQQGLGGLGRHAVNLSRSLASAGHLVDFMGNNLVDYQEVSKDIELPGRFFPELDMRNIGWKEVRMGIYNPLRRPFIAWRFARAIMRRAADYDVVHYHGHFPLLANYIPKDVNFVQTRHDQGSDCLGHIRFRNHDVCRGTSPFDCAACATPFPNALQKIVSASAVWIYRKLVARAFRRHKTIFVSDMLRRNFCRTAGAGLWGEIIHNFVDYSDIKNYAATGKPESGLIEVFIAGKLYEAKGIEAFLELIPQKVSKNFHITIAGDGDKADELRERYGSDMVVFLGWQSHAKNLRFMKEADVVVVPSICEEAFGLVTLEGLTLGKKVLALDLGATPELKKYECYPGQLSLFRTMSDLVEELFNLKEEELHHTISPHGCRAGVEAVRDQIINLYIAGRRMQ